MRAFSFRRLFAILAKEFVQLRRDSKSDGYRSDHAHRAHSWILRSTSFARSLEDECGAVAIRIWIYHYQLQQKIAEAEMVVTAAVAIRAFCDYSVAGLWL